MEDYFFGPTYSFDYPPKANTGYYQSPWPQPSPPPPPCKPKKVFSVPIADGNPKPSPKATKPSPVARPNTNAKSATKIQKVFRGYRVRKNVKKIMEIRDEVHDAEREVVNALFFEKVIEDERERIRISEMLMGLLLKLDSVKGVNDVVRECRKGFIKEAILLQEKIDAAKVEGEVDVEEDVDEIDDDVEDDDVDESDTDVTDDEEGEEEDESLEERKENFDVGVEEKEENVLNADVGIGEKGEILKKLDHEKITDDVFNESSSMEEEDGSGEEEGGSGDHVRVADVSAENQWRKIVDDYFGRAAEGSGDYVEEEEGAEVESEEKGEWECVEEGGDGVAVARAGSGEWCVVEGEEKVEEKRDEKKKVLEKLAEDNERMMTMIEDLTEKNANQASLISALTQRVEELEKWKTDSLNEKYGRNFGVARFLRG